MTKSQQRANVVREAKEWIGTKYHVGGRIKGIGVDCGTLLAEVYERAGVIPHLDIRPYRGDEHLHNHEEEYLGLVLKFAHEIRSKKKGPGDVVLWKFGKRLSHSAIIVDWPLVIHATIRERKVWLCDISQDVRYAEEPRFFSPWP